MSDHWTSTRPSTLVVTCSDGRLQTATDRFLERQLGVTRYDRFYIPGGAGALASSGRDVLRARQMRREYRYLIDLHRVGRVVLMVHGPAPNGPPEAVCADYRRKLSWASPAAIRDRQTSDIDELLARRDEWAGAAEIVAFRAEVGPAGAIAFVALSP